MRLQLVRTEGHQGSRSKALLSVVKMPAVGLVRKTRISTVWLLITVVLTLLVTMVSALALSKPTVGRGESEGNGALEVESPGFLSEQRDSRSDNQFFEKGSGLQVDQAMEGSRLFFPVVLVGEAELVKQESIFLPLFAKPGAFCANRVVRSGDKLAFNGRQINLIGMNVSYLLEEWFPDSDWDGILSFLSRSGNTVRIFVFPKHVRDGGLDRVERLVRLGGKYGLKFIIALENYMAADYPTKNEAWFQSGYKGEYMDHLRSVVTRLRNYPEVALWQLMNEPSCNPEGWSQSCCDSLVEWVGVASEAIKKLDPCRPVAVGMISAGGYQPHEEDTWRRMHSFPSIDAMTLHIWTGSWHKRELRIAAELNLPVLFTEVYHRAYKKNGTLLYGGVLEERAPIIEEFMQRSFDAGIDGIILWQYIYQGYPWELDYDQNDPVWKVLRSFANE